MAIHNIGIADRETVEYAMSLPDIIRVDIKRGGVITDRREIVYPLWYMDRLGRQTLIRAIANTACGKNDGALARLGAN